MRNSNLRSDQWCGNSQFPAANLAKGVDFSRKNGVADNLDEFLYRSGSRH
jgi:hypothetical protein